MSEDILYDVIIRLYVAFYGLVSGSKNNYHRKDDAQVELQTQISPVLNELTFSIVIVRVDSL